MVDELVTEVPTPEWVAVLETVGLVRLERVPLWAAHWLVDGHDGEALRTLAGLRGADTREVRDVLSDALAECGSPAAVDPTAAVFAVFAGVARRYNAVSGVDKWVLGLVDLVLTDSDFPDAVWRMPLAGLYDPDYEWGCECGSCRSEEVIREVVRRACGEQIALAEGLPG